MSKVSTVFQQIAKKNSIKDNFINEILNIQYNNFYLQS